MRPDIVVIDFETTGLLEDTGCDYSFPLPIELGSVKLRYNSERKYEIVDMFGHLIQYPDLTLSPFITKFTGITDHLLKTNGLDVKDVFKRFQKWCDGCVLAAWPISYEMPILKNVYAEFLGYNKAGERKFPLGRRALDIFTLAAHRLGLSDNVLDMSCSKACMCLGIEVTEPRHRAWADAITEAEVLMKILNA